jgi:hypothetical protein
MLVHGAYQALLGVDGLKLNDTQLSKLYQSIIDNCYIRQLDSVLATLELIKMLIEKYKLPTKLTEAARNDIEMLKKDGISLIKDK